MLITTYNEPVEMVAATAEASERIVHPHTTWILDDGARPELERAARETNGTGSIGRRRAICEKKDLLYK